MQPSVWVIRKKWSDATENLADLLDNLKGILFLQYYQCLIVTWRFFQSCSPRSIYLKMVIANYHKPKTVKKYKKEFFSKGTKAE